MDSREVRELWREPDPVKKFFYGKEKGDCISCKRCLAVRRGKMRCLQIGD